jgi:CHAD domain-containing protein
MKSPSPAPPMQRDIPAKALLAKGFRDFLDEMRECVPGVIDGADIEQLHDFRVAVRRTRATLKLGRPALPAVTRRRWEPAFRWLGDLTTPVRDLDVYQQGLPTMAGWLESAERADLEPFAAHLRSRRAAESVALVRGLRSARFRRLVTEWEEELARLGERTNGTNGANGINGTNSANGTNSTNGTDGTNSTRSTNGTKGANQSLSAGELADRSISRTYLRVMRGGTAIDGDSPAEDLHTLRKRCKELRYALEVFAPVIDDASGRKAIGALKGLQDVLGRFQDCEVQRGALREFADEMKIEGAPSRAMVAMGELIGHLDAEQDRARREFDVAFARFARPSSQRLMHELGGGW